MPTNRIQHLGAVGVVVAVGLAAASGAVSAPATGSRLAVGAAQASSKIAFIRAERLGRTVNYELYVMNADGSGQRRLARTAWLESPAWSPNGRRIAFYRYGEGIYVVNADGSGEQRLTRKWSMSPAWSPDGRRIAFVSGRDGTWEVYVMNADGSGQRRLTRNTSTDAFPAWSPDGRKIAFSNPTNREIPPGGVHVYVVNADGSGQRRLTRESSGAPAWVARRAEDRLRPRPAWGGLRHERRREQTALADKRRLARLVA